MVTRTYTVEGMTCANCVKHVTEEVTGIPGLQGVEIDLATGAMIVTAEVVDDAAVRAAVDEAGYTVVG